MSEAAPVTAPLVSSRQGKFTPVTIRQITNLLERGKTKEEIAEIIGVTPGTLQVTCSKLGISLRRHAFESNAPRSRAPRSGDREAAQPQSLGGAQALGAQAQVERRGEQIQMAPEATPVEDHSIVRLHPKPKLSNNPGLNGVALTIQYKGEEKIIDLRLDRNLLGQLALEAEFRSMGLGDLIGGILLSVTKNDLFEFVLEQSPG